MPTFAWTGLDLSNICGPQMTWDSGMMGLADPYSVKLRCQLHPLLRHGRVAISLSSVTGIGLSSEGLCPNGSLWPRAEEWSCFS